MRCRKCGAVVSRNDKFCICCGAEVDKNAVQISKPSAGYRKRTVGLVSAGLLLLVIIFLILGLTGVIPIFSNDSAQKATLAIDEYLNRQEEDTFEGGFVIPEKEANADIIGQMILDNVEYKIIETGNDHMTIEITSLDLQAVMTEVTDEIEKEGYSDNEFDEAKQKAQSMIIEIISRGGLGKVTNTVEVGYTVLDGRYVIDENEDFVNAVYGGVLDTLNEYNEALGIDF